jgi:hypothetical protein
MRFPAPFGHAELMKVSTLTSGGGAYVVGVKHLRWLAVGPLALGIIFLFIAMLWWEEAQLAVAVALFAAAAGVWRAFAGTWPRMSDAR